MTCFMVRSSIHPISAPTGTEDDIEGNNKADALCWERWRKNRDLGCQRNVVVNPDYSNVAFIYDTSHAGMHLWVV
jgi:hypothetical protein